MHGHWDRDGCEEPASFFVGHLAAYYIVSGRKEAILQVSFVNVSHLSLHGCKLTEALSASVQKQRETSQFTISLSNKSTQEPSDLGKCPK